MRKMPFVIIQNELWVFPQIFKNLHYQHHYDGKCLNIINKLKTSHTYNLKDTLKLLLQSVNPQRCREIIAISCLMESNIL